VAGSKLVFVGVRNLAQTEWCAMQAVRCSRRQEISAFQTYITERLAFCLQTRRVGSLPVSRDAWLELAAPDPPLAIVESLLLPRQWQRFYYVGRYWETYDGYRTWAEPDFPTMSWHFSLAGYVIVGEPDGLSRTEVLEAKSARTNYLARFQRPVGELQADLYGVLFERKAKVICLTVGPGDFELQRSEVRHDAVANCLRTFARVDGGWLPRPPSEAWKCRNCEVNDGCPIRRC